MRTVEWIVLAYLAYAAGLASVWPLRGRARAVVLAVAAADAALIVWLGTRTSAGALALRDWLPAAQLLVGYRLTGPFFSSPMARVEARLAASDRWWFDTAGLDAFARRAPRLILELLELAYASAYLMVPLGFALVVWSRAPVDAGRYWTPVVAAALVCYGLLPWIRARTPGALNDHTAVNQRPIALRRLNQGIQQYGSIRVATIPSGHAACAMATALMAGGAVPWALAPLVVLALVIAFASVIGRYHYMADVLLGLVVGALAVLLNGSISETVC